MQSVSEASVISSKYTFYMNVFLTEKAELLLTHKVSDHVIDLNEKNSLYSLLYNLFNTKLKILQKYLDDILMKD